MYESHKRSHHNTADDCKEQGLQFLPMVAEGCGGGWGVAGIAVWRTLGHLIADRSGDLRRLRWTVFSNRLQSLCSARMPGLPFSDCRLWPLCQQSLLSLTPEALDGVCGAAATRVMEKSSVHCDGKMAPKVCPHGRLGSRG